jgi:hypothetical protein
MLDVTLCLHVSFLFLSCLVLIFRLAIVLIAHKATHILLDKCDSS